MVTSNAQPKNVIITSIMLIQGKSLSSYNNTNIDEPYLDNSAQPGSQSNKRITTPHCHSPLKPLSLRT